MFGARDCSSSSLLGALGHGGKLFPLPLALGTIVVRLGVGAGGGTSKLSLFSSDFDDTVCFGPEIFDVLLTAEPA